MKTLKFKPDAKGNVPKSVMHPVTGITYTEEHLKNPNLEKALTNIDKRHKTTWFDKIFTY